MRHVRDVIRLKSAGMSTREIARRVGTAPSTVRLTIRRFEAAGLPRACAGAHDARPPSPARPASFRANVCALVSFSRMTGSIAL
jgi:transposase